MRTAALLVLVVTWLCPSLVRAQTQVPASERQISVGVIGVKVVGLPNIESAAELGLSLGYRYATPRWSLGAVADLTLQSTTYLPKGERTGYGALASSARWFLGPGGTSPFVGTGLGLVFVTERWNATGQGRVIDIERGEITRRDLASPMVIAELGLVVGRTQALTFVASVRADLPLLPFARTHGAFPERPATYITPVSLRVGAQW